MPKQLCLSAVIDLPDDLFKASEFIAELRPIWGGLLDRLEATPDLHYQTKCETMEVRAKAARKPRRPRLVPSPEAA